MTLSFEEEGAQELVKYHKGNKQLCIILLE